LTSVPSNDLRFRRIFDAHHRELHAYCLRRLPIEDADEATSEIFLVAWRRSGQLPTGEEARLWLYGVARNVVRNWERSGRRRLRLAAKSGSIAQPQPDGPEVHVIRKEEHREVVEAIATLNQRDQEVVTLKIWECLSNREVAAVLGLTDRAVEARYTRAIKKLSRYLKRGDTAATSSPFSPERGEAAS
jgi:RNA polymerase sigma-70 factor (ECF subfamily)